MKKQILILVCALFSSFMLKAQDNYPPTSVNVTRGTAMGNGEYGDPTISWSAPSAPDTLRYCSDVVKSSYGFIGGYQLNAGIMYSPEELRAKKLTGKRITSISVYSRAANIKYVAKIWTIDVDDFDNQGASDHLTLNFNAIHEGWNTVMLPNPVRIDTAPEQNLIVGFYSDSYTAEIGPACFDSGPVDPHGHMLMLNGVWTNVGPDFPGNLMVKFTTEDPTITAAPDGYIVERSADGGVNWASVGTQQASTTFNMVDNDWSTLSPGKYNYAVTAVYPGGSSTRIPTQYISSKMEFTVKFEVKNAMNAPIQNVGTGICNLDVPDTIFDQYSYTRPKTNANGESTVLYVQRGQNKWQVEKNGYVPVSGTFNAIKDTTYQIALQYNAEYSVNTVKATVQNKDSVEVHINAIPANEGRLSYTTKQNGYLGRNNLADSTTWAMAFSKDDIQKNGWAGKQITTIYIDAVLANRPYYIKIWDNKYRPTVLMRQEVYFSTVGWKEVKLETPFTIPADINYLVIGATTASDTNSLKYPASFDTNKNIFNTDSKLMYNDLKDSFEVFSGNAGAAMLVAYINGADQSNASQFNVYRRLESAAKGTGTLIGSTTDTIFKERNWNTVPSGRYVYDVAAQYTATSYTDTVQSNTIGSNDQMAAVTVVLKDQWSSPVKAAYGMLTSDVNNYSETADNNGKLIFPSVLINDPYALDVTKAKYETINLTGVTFTKDTTINLSFTQNRFRVQVTLSPVAGAQVSGALLKMEQAGKFSFTRAFSNNTIACDTVLSGPTRITITKTNYKTIDTTVDVVNDMTVRFTFQLPNREAVDKPLVGIHPNPTTGKFVVEADDEILDVHIYNMMTQAVMPNSLTKNGKIAEIDLSSFKGVYFVEVKTVKGRAYRRVIVQ